jgi:hypothetical protein
MELSDIEMEETVNKNSEIDMENINEEQISTFLAEMFECVTLDMMFDHTVTLNMEKENEEKRLEENIESTMENYRSTQEEEEEESKKMSEEERAEIQRILYGNIEELIVESAKVEKSEEEKEIAEILRKIKNIKGGKNRVFQFEIEKHKLKYEQSGCKVLEPVLILSILMLFTYLFFLSK